MIIAFPVILLAGCISVDLIAFRSARPPSGLKTIQEFESWKGKTLMGKGEYQNSGTNYTVMLAPAGRSLASGPSAYLFDQNGNFVDWTSDMGDFETRKYQFDLSNGRVKRSKSSNR